MRLFAILCLLFLIVTPIVVSAAGADTCADARERLSALEKELAEVRKELKELLKSLASRESSWESYTNLARTSAANLLAHISHLGSNGVDTMKAYIPVLINHATAFSKDLPGYSHSAYTIVESQTRTWYSLAYQFLSTMLGKQGVPKDYVNYLTIGILFSVGLAILLITFTILSSILSLVFSFLCCRRKKSSSSSSKKKKNKNPQPQHS